MHHNNCFRCIFYHQSMTKKSCWYHKFLFFDLYFESYSSNGSNTSHSAKRFCIHYDLLLQQHFCLRPLPFYVLYYYLPNMNTSLALIDKFFNSNNSCFIFYFTNNYFVWIILIFWLSSIIDKVKHLFIFAKISIDIFSFNFVHQTVSVCE